MLAKDGLCDYDPVRAVGDLALITANVLAGETPSVNISLKGVSKPHAID